MPGPFNRHWNRLTRIAMYENVPCEQYSLTWYTSPRENGGLVLRGNEMSLMHHVNLSHSESYNVDWGGAILIPLYNHVSVPNSLWDNARQRALSEWYGKLKGDNSASLGVTIGSWRQSWSMIAKRYGQISKIARDVAQKSASRTRVIEKRYAESFKRMDDRMKDLHFRLAAMQSRSNLWKPADVRRLKRLIRNEEKRRARSQDALRRDLEKASSANLFLEGAFGWAPLLNDIVNTAKTLTGDNFPAGYISGSGRAVAPVESSAPSPGNLVVLGGTFEVRSKYTAQVSVSNPNVWLANQLGLLNPAVVAWDLVPWSWVVGMFVNVQQILESFTALYGLAVTDITRTDQARIVSSVAKESAYPTDHPGYARSSATGLSRYKARVRLVGIPTPALTLRMPKLSMTLGLIGASTLGVQLAKFSRNQKN